MKNTNTSKVRPQTLKERRKDLNAELTLSDWKTAISENSANKLIEDLALMAKEDTKMITTLPWRLKHGLSESTIHALKNKYPSFKSAYKEALDILAHKIYEHAFWKRGDYNAAKLVLPKFSDEFKEMIQEQAALKAFIEKAKQPNISIVEIPTFKPSGLVPDKKEDE